MQPSQTRELATFDAYGAIVEAAPDYLTRSQIELAKRTVCRDLDDREFLTFLMIAARTGLDVFSKQIYAIKRGGVMTIQTGIDGYNAIADKTQELAGVEPIEYDRMDAAHPNWARATVYRRKPDGYIAKFTYTALWMEYVQTDRDGRPASMWRKMPYSQLGKCALARAFRLGFPAQLSGIYTKEEMEQADNPTIVGGVVVEASHAPVLHASVNERNVTPIRPVASRTAETVDQLVAMTTVPAEPTRKRTPNELYADALELGWTPAQWMQVKRDCKNDFDMIADMIAHSRKKQTQPARELDHDVTSDSDEGADYPPEDSAEPVVTPAMVADKERHAQEDDAQTALEAFNGEFESVEGEQTQSPDMLATAAWNTLQRRMAALNMSVGTQDDFILQMTGKASDATLTPEDYHTLDAALAVYEQEHAAKSGSNDLRNLNTGRGNKGRS